MTDEQEAYFRKMHPTKAHEELLALGYIDTHALNDNINKRVQTTLDDSGKNSTLNEVK